MKIKDMLYILGHKLTTWSGFAYTWDIATENKTDTWVPVIKNQTIQHRDEQDWVVEKGNDYIRYNSGIQICWGEFEENVSVTLSGTYYMGITSTINYSKPFIVPPAITANISSFGTGYFWGGVRVETASGFTANAIKNQSGTAKCEITYVAIGRWK